MSLDEPNGQPGDLYQWDVPLGGIDALTVSRPYVCLAIWSRDGVIWRSFLRDNGSILFMNGYRALGNLRLTQRLT